MTKGRDAIVFAPIELLECQKFGRLGFTLEAKVQSLLAPEGLAWEQFFEVIRQGPVGYLFGYPFLLDPNFLQFL